jgi:hypothetical protein
MLISTIASWEIIQHSLVGDRMIGQMSADAAWVGLWPRSQASHTWAPSRKWWPARSGRAPDRAGPSWPPLR